MIYLIIFVIEIIIIFFLAKRVQKIVSTALFRITKSKKATIYIMSILFLPGTFVHEMAHFLFALFLLVPVGNMKLIPEIEENGVKLGSVSIAQTDPLRRFLIGAAPLFLGVSIILSIFYFFPISNYLENWIRSLLLLYLVFTISNSMFSSKRDMEGIWGFVVVMVLISTLFWYFGIRLDLTVFINNFSELFKSASIFLLAPILIDVLCLYFTPKK